MIARLLKRRRDESGMSFVFIGMAFMAFMAASTLAVDVGMFMTARSQAQNSADAGALAGAVALLFNDFVDRSPTSPAVQSAVNTARNNLVMGGRVSVTPADVEFPNDPAGQPDRVKVTVYRTAARAVEGVSDGAVKTLIGSLFGVDQADISATATAEASPANAMTCVKPFMIPDKWREVGTPPWDTNDTFDMYDSSNNLLPSSIRDIYIGADQPGYTGYTTQNDKGTQLVLRAGTGDQPNPSFYYSWKMPGDVGGAFYRDNIAHCNQTVMHWGTIMIQEPGDKSGPTIQGIQQLIDQDPGAYWNRDCECVQGSAFEMTPRVFPIPLYDPEYYASGKANGRPASFRVANFLGFFADHVEGNRIYGRITAISGIVDTTAGPAPAGMIPRAIRLVQ